MKYSILIMLILSLTVTSHAQEEKTTVVVDAGKVIVDLLSLFKSPKSSHQSEEKIIAPVDECLTPYTSHSCFTNGNKRSLRVFLYQTSTPADTTELIISDRSQECIYGVATGVYTYVALFLDNNELYRKGQTQLLACQENIVEIGNR